MGYRYRYRQTLVLLKNKYPENLFFCKKKIKKYNYLFEENEAVIKKTKKNLYNSSLQQYWRGHKEKAKIETKKMAAIGAASPSNSILRLPEEPLSKIFVNSKFILLYTFDHIYSKLLFHGSGYKRVSYFFEKIRERKKLKILYGYYNRKYLQKRNKALEKYSFNYGAAKISGFEFNINFILCRCGFFTDIRKAEQMIGGKRSHYLLNNKNIFSTHMEINKGDVVSIRKNYTWTPIDTKFFNKKTGYSKFHRRSINFFYKKLSIETNKLKYRFFCTDRHLHDRKTFYIYKKFH